MHKPEYEWFYEELLPSKARESTVYLLFAKMLTCALMMTLTADTYTTYFKTSQQHFLKGENEVSVIFAKLV